MISVPDALKAIQSDPWVPGEEQVPLAEAAGRVLSRAILADREGPPYDRVAMDGFAVDSAEVVAGRSAFRVTALQPAGAAPLRREGPGTAIEVATGSILPLGCDAVVPREHMPRSGDQAALEPGFPVRPWLNVHRKGSDYRLGAALIPEGTALRAPHLHVLATVGQVSVPVRQRPRLALAATGDELVEVAATPLPHQIRRSNLAAIRAEARAWGFEALPDAVIPDEEGPLEAALRRLLSSCEVLVMTGGVSQGARDLVPLMLARLGAEARFHRVAQKPGKPMWFGRVPGGPRIFALPGNPVSSLFTFRRYVLPALLAWEGRPVPEHLRAVQDLEIQPLALTQFLPVVERDGQLRGMPRGGSGDLLPMTLSSGFVQAAPGASGRDPLPYFPWGHP